MLANIFKRSKRNPILRPIKNHAWESKKVYNPGAILHNNAYHLFYRAIGNKNISSIGYALAKNGKTFKRYKTPILEPATIIESHGIEDPRISKVSSKFYLTYTAFDKKTARLCLATSPDMKSWQRQGEIFPNWNSKRAGEFLLPWDRAQKTVEARKHWLKAGAIFPEKINGKYWMFFGDRLLWSASSRNGINWVPEYSPLISPRRNLFDSVHVEMGPPPIRTEEGWLVLYHGVDESVTYRLGYLLLDLHDPLNIIARSNQAIFEPQEKYELKGKPDIDGNQKISPQIIFCNGAILKDNILHIYYGAGDSVVCTATALLQDILSAK